MKEDLTIKVTTDLRETTMNGDHMTVRAGMTAAVIILTGITALLTEIVRAVLVRMTTAKVVVITADHLITTVAVMEIIARVVTVTIVKVVTTQIAKVATTAVLLMATIAHSRSSFLHAVTSSCTFLRRSIRSAWSFVIVRTRRTVVGTATTIRTVIVAVRGAILAIRRTAVLATFAI